jgi:ABC-type multidrug transport system ATPase subunit
MNEAEILCNRVAIIHKGNLIALDTPEALKQLAPRSKGRLPSLEDVFIHLTGDRLKDEQKEDIEAAQAFARALADNFSGESEEASEEVLPVADLN